MDRRSLEYTREHYNKHSNQFATTQEALAARATGPGAPLKKFHNTIKRLLIQRWVGSNVVPVVKAANLLAHELGTCSIPRFAWQADRLLDLACGRGGDIWKWIDAGILRVKGIDLSPDEIEEAEKRLRSSEKDLVDIT